MPTPLDPAKLEAKRLGLKRYSTGKPCANGHHVERQTSTGKCLECIRLHRLRQYHNNPEHARARKRRQDASHPEHINAQRRAYAQAHPDRVRASSKRWRERYPEKVRNRWKTYISAPGTHTVADLRDILKQQRFRCAMCRISLRRVRKHKDHIIPLVAGGTNDRSNIQFLCQPCNLSKSAKDPVQYAREMGLLI